MANWDNHHTKEVQAETMSSYERGFWDGYASNLQQLPACYHKPVYMLKPYERGLFLGREVRLTERAAGIDELADAWPTLDGVPDGVDLFAEYPVVGEPQS